MEQESETQRLRRLEIAAANEEARASAQAMLRYWQEQAAQVAKSHERELLIAAEVNSDEAMFPAYKIKAN